MLTNIGRGMSPLAGRVQTPIIDLASLSNQDLASTYSIGDIYSDEGFEIRISNEHAARDNYTAGERLLNISDGTANNQIQIAYADTDGQINLRVDVGGVTEVNETVSLGTAYLPLKKNFVLRYDGTTFEVGLNGTRFIEPVEVPVPASPTQFHVGQEAASTNEGTGTIPQIQIYDKPTAGNAWRTWSRHLEIYSGVSEQSGVVGIVGTFSQSNQLGIQNYTMVYSNAAQMKMLDLSGSYVDYASGSSDDTSSVHGSVLGANSSTAYESYMGKLIDTLAGYTDETYMYVPASKGSTKIITDWAQYTNGRISFGMWAAIQRGLAARQVAGGGVLCTCIHIGESDARQSTSKANFKVAMKNSIAEYRLAVFGNASHPIIINTIHKWHSGISGGSEATWNAIIEAIEEVADEDANIYLVDNSDILGDSNDRVHVLGEGYYLLASNNADVIIDNLLTASSYTSPLTDADFYWNFRDKANATFDDATNPSTAAVEFFAAIAGTVAFVRQGAGEEAFFDPAPFDGKGGLSAIDTSTIMLADLAKNLPTGTYYFVLELDVTGTQRVIGKGASGNIDSDTRMLQHNANSDNFFLQPTTNFGKSGVSRLVYCLRVNSTGGGSSDIDVFLNTTTGTNITTNTDELSTRQELIIFGAVNYASIAGCAFAETAVYDPTAHDNATVASKMNALATEYGVTLS